MPGYGTRRVTDMTIEEQARAYHDEKVVRPARNRSLHLQQNLSRYIRNRKHAEKLMGATVVRVEMAEYGSEPDYITIRRLDGHEHTFDLRYCDEY